MPNPNVGLGWSLDDSVVCGGWYSNGWLRTNPMDREFGTLTAPFHAGQTERFRCEDGNEWSTADIEYAIQADNLTFLCISYSMADGYTVYTDDGSGMTSYGLKCTGMIDVGADTINILILIASKMPVRPVRMEA